MCLAVTELEIQSSRDELSNGLCSISLAIPELEIQSSRVELHVSNGLCSMSLAIPYKAQLFHQLTFVWLSYDERVVLHSAADCAHIDARIPHLGLGDGEVGSCIGQHMARWQWGIGSTPHHRGTQRAAAEQGDWSTGKL